MSLINKYDNTLRDRLALRAVWLPGTLLKVGDICQIINGALTGVANINDYEISYTEKPISDKQSINIQAQGVSHTVIQNNAIIDLKNVKTNIEAELKISFGQENTYFLRTPVLKGVGLERALSLAKKIARIPGWDFRQHYIVHKIWSARDFVFLGSLEKNKSISFSGKGEAIKDLLNNGISSQVTSSGTIDLAFDVKGTSGPIVMQVFRVKKKGGLY